MGEEDAEVSYMIAESCLLALDLPFQGRTKSSHALSSDCYLKGPLRRAPPACAVPPFPCSQSSPYSLTSASPFPHLYPEPLPLSSRAANSAPTHPPPSPERRWIPSATSSLLFFLTKKERRKKPPKPKTSKCGKSLMTQSQFPAPSTAEKAPKQSFGAPPAAKPT